jgi:chromosome segregation ATPase
VLQEEAEHSRAAHEEGRGLWETQRQELHAQWEEKQRLQIQEVEERHSAAQAQTAAARKQLQEEQEALRGEFAQAKTTFQDEVERSRAAAAAVQQEIEALRAQLDAVRQERDQLIDKGREQEAAHKETEQRLRSELDQLAETLDENWREEARVARSCDEQAEQIKALHAERASLQAELEQVRSDRGTTHFEVERLGTEVAALQFRADRLSEAEALAARLQADLAAVGSRLQEFDAVRVERDELTARVETLQAELDHLARRQADLRPEAPNGAAKLDTSAESDSQSGDERLEACRQEFARERAALQGEVTRLQQKNAWLRQWLGNVGIYIDASQ